jgi:hypothetical protein
MKPRPALTLLEVLVAIFVAGVGMLALLVLFPLGAVHMAGSLRDDRCAQAAAQAAALANALDLRNDSNVTTVLNQGKPVYVDPVGVQYITSLPATVGDVAGGIPRRTTDFLTNPPRGAAVRPWVLKYCSLADDLAFDGNGGAASSGGFLDRGRRYTWAYLARRPYPNALVVGAPPGLPAPTQIDLDVVVYGGRNLQAPGGETAYPATHTAGSTRVVLDWSGKDRPAVKRGSWVLDSSPSTEGAERQTLGQVHGFFYRVVAAEELGPDSLQLVLQTKPLAAIRQLVVLEDVAEVFPRKAGWRP